MMGGMGERKRKLVPIGRFSKMTRLSVKALRVNDENGADMVCGALCDHVPVCQDDGCCELKSVGAEWMESK